MRVGYHGMRTINVRLGYAETIYSGQSDRAENLVSGRLIFYLSC